MELTKIATQEDINRQWIVLDAKDQVFGRLITQAACFTPNIDCGDFVVIINATEVKFTGMKLKDKEYFTHSGYFGSTKSKTLEEMLQKSPEKLFHLAVRGMLPKTKLGRAMLKKLKVYRGNEHPHSAQISKSTQAAKGK